MVEDGAEGTDSRQTTSDDEVARGFGVWLAGITLGDLVFVTLIVGIYAFSSPNGWTILSVGIVTSCAAAAIGGLAGFLFGIPRILQSDSLAPNEDSRVLANSNLEQISDWLTKILVGASLVQITAVPSALGSLSAMLAPAFGNQPSSGSFAIGVIIFSVVGGFMIVYAWTRTKFLEILKRSANKRAEMGS